MKITVKSIFEPSEIELDTQSTTLGALLDELSDNKTVKTTQFFDSRLREIYSDCEVAINKHAVTDGLDTKLKDGDKIEIYLVMLGGG